VLALVAIAAGIVFGFTLGLGFAIMMVGLSAGYVVYYTSNVLHHYRSDQHVAAALSLFSAIALMFWYILSIFMRE
jgi:FtsH-binding integral membrane protein